ncbi:jg6299 [Pararge aegeria aegeria]|uniref:Jg6299 protein n=1 Tax=Pararge aegeria aegeria TaxID=348720 RepID=A0A8S4RIL5_9NEOP|nr:jg6299 [Pararge aegeria aegeria]
MSSGTPTCPARSSTSYTQKTQQSSSGTNTSYKNHTKLTKIEDEKAYGGEEEEMTWKIVTEGFWADGLVVALAAQRSHSVGILGDPIVGLGELLKAMVRSISAACNYMRVTGCYRLSVLSSFGKHRGSAIDVAISHGDQRGCGGVECLTW